MQTIFMLPYPKARFESCLRIVAARWPSKQSLACEDIRCIETPWLPSQRSPVRRVARHRLSQSAGASLAQRVRQFTNFLYLPSECTQLRSCAFSPVTSDELRSLVPRSCRQPAGSVPLGQASSDHCQVCPSPKPSPSRRWSITSYDCIWILCVPASV